MTSKDRLVIERNLGVIDGIASSLTDENASDALIGATEAISYCLSKIASYEEENSEDKEMK